MSKKTKQSLLIGALTSSFGIFVSKMLGLFYVVPLNSLAGEGNMVFYSIAYTYYDLLLKICGAGIPFAIAAMVAKYYSREDYKTVLLIKKLGSSLLLISSFVIALFFVAFSYPLASGVMGETAVESDIIALNNLFRILAIALILVPYLSSIRGYYQGLKCLGIYASSQVIEQFVRVFSIIFLGYITVSIFKFDSIYAIYMAMLSAAIGALITIVYLHLNTRNEDKDIKELALSQQKSEKSAASILSEMLSLGIPYLVISFLGTASSLVNSNFFMSYATGIGVEYNTAKLVLGILQVNCNKIAAIPQVLTLGFSAGLVPYLTEDLESHDYKALGNHILDILDTVLFILVPLVTWLVIYARPVYYIMYGNSNLDLGTQIFVVSSLTTLTDTVAPIISSTCITLRERKSTIIVLLISALVKFISFFILIRLFGYNGMIYSTALASMIAIILNLYIIERHYHVRYGRIFRRLTVTVFGALLSCLPLLLMYAGIGFNYQSRVLCIVMLGIFGILSLLIYLAYSTYTGMFEMIFGKSPVSYIRKLIKK